MTIKYTIDEDFVFYQINLLEDIKNFLNYSIKSLPNVKDNKETFKDYINWSKTVKDLVETEIDELQLMKDNEI